MFWKKQKYFQVDIEDLRGEIAHLKDLLGTHAGVIKSMGRDFEVSTQITNEELRTIRKNLPSLLTIDDRIDERVKKVAAYFHDAMKSSEDSVKDRIAGVLKHVSHKIELLLGDKDKTAMVNDLLKRIAYLEDVKEAEGKMRSSEEILGTLHGLNKKAMALDSQDKKDPILSEQINILLWVLGEEKDANNS